MGGKNVKTFFHFFSATQQNSTVALNEKFVSLSYTVPVRRLTSPKIKFMSQLTHSISGLKRDSLVYPSHHRYLVGVLARGQGCFWTLASQLEIFDFFSHFCQPRKKSIQMIKNLAQNLSQPYPNYGNRLKMVVYENRIRLNRIISN